MSTRELLLPLARLAATRWSPSARGALLAAALMVAASALFALQAALVKASLQSIAPLELVFFRGLICAVLILAFARIGGLSLKTAHPVGQAVLGGVGFVSMALYFMSIGLLPLVTATALNYTAPLFLALFVALQAARKAGASAVWTAAGFAGVCLVLQPSLGAGDPAGVVYGLLSGLTGAFCYLLLGRLGHAGEPQRVTAFYFSAIACAAAAGPTLARGFSVESAEQLALVLAIGVLATVAQLAVVKAYAMSSPLIPSTFSYSAVIFSSILGALWWGDQLGLAEALGIALIVASGVLVSATGPSLAPRRAAARADPEEEQRQRLYRKNNLRSLYAVYRLAKDPGQTRFVFMISTAQDDIAESERLRGTIKDAFRSPDLEGLWQARYGSPAYDLDALMGLAPDTLGGAYARHMKASGLKPDYYPEAHPRHRMNFLRLRIHKTHDIWHLLTGFGMDEFGEVGLQGFYFGQFTSGQAALIGAAAILKSVLRGRLSDLEKHVDAFCEGYCSGKRAESLLAVKWEDLWGEKLEDLRRRYRIAVRQGASAFPSAEAARG